MSNTPQKTKLYHWILALTVAGIFVFLVSGGGGFQERLPSFAAVHDETDWTLANNEDVYEEMVDWTLAKNDSKDTNENEPDWTLARNEGHDQEEVDWTLA